MRVVGRTLRGRRGGSDGGREESRGGGGEKLKEEEGGDEEMEEELVPAAAAAYCDHCRGADDGVADAAAAASAAAPAGAAAGIRGRGLPFHLRFWVYYGRVVKTASPLLARPALLLLLPVVGKREAKESD